MSVERSLNVKINTVGDPSGAKEVGSALGQLTEKTTEAWKSGEKLEGAHHKLREIMHQIGEETAPEMGRALFAVTEGPVGAVIALGFAFKFLGDQISESNKKIQELKEDDAQGEFLPGIEARTAALAAIRQELAKYKFDMEHATSAEKQFATELANEVKLLDARFAAMNKIAAAEAAAAAAKVQARTDLTPEEKAFMESALGRNTAASENARTRAHENEMIATKENAFHEHSQQQVALDAAAQAAITKAGTSEASRKRAEADLPGQKEELPKLQALLEKVGEEASKAREEAEKQRKIYEAGPKGFVGADTDVKNAEAYAANREEMRKLVENAFNMTHRAIESFQTKKDSASTDEAEKAKAIEEATKNREAANALINEIKELTALSKIRQSGATGYENASDSANAAIEAVRLAAQAQAHRETATTEQINALNMLIDIALKQHASVTTLQAQLKQLGSGTLGISATQAEIQSILDALDKRLNTSNQNSQGH